MTTHYTTTQDITTPGVVLTDFTITVPAPSQSSLGINAYGSGTGADINTFDIGPCGDSCVILETLAIGAGDHIHDGAVHDSRTPAWGDPSVGVHGIYDKSAGTLVENIEFYNHPAGEAYSPRYGNTCKSCVFHNTPFSIGLFNYQGSTLGAGGTLRVRDCVFYNLPSGGYVFYSDGTWRESNGTLLGDSLISVEIDHCTIDIRGVTDPFNFHDCHNDVYLTNCVVISDSGLPLSSIIVAPVDGSTVHLDGSVVLNSADAATYLGPAPTFTPIVVGGSPIIGTAAASPPVSFAQFGNEGDVGASQTGSSPPGPPPLPGPSLPTLASLGVIGVGFADGSDVLTIPISTSVVRSDPTLGASIVIIYPLNIDAAVLTAADDAPTDSFYSTHLYTAGTNPYEHQPGTVVWRGLLLNPLVGGSDNIILQLSAASTFNAAIAVAYTGVQVNNQSNPTYQVPDLPVATWFEGLAIPGPFGTCGNNPIGTPEKNYVNWDWDTSGPPRVPKLLEPFPLSYPTWSIETGDLAVYFVVSSPFSTVDPGDFIPDDGTWVEIGSIINNNAGGSPPSYSVAVFEKPLVVPELDDDLDGTFATADEMSSAQGYGYMITAGLGPIWLTEPPTGGAPVFNNHIRLSE